jgi:hypothetical protein
MCDFQYIISYKKTSHTLVIKHHKCVFCNARIIYEKQIKASYIYICANIQKSSASPNIDLKKKVRTQVMGKGKQIEKKCSPTLNSYI